MCILYLITHDHGTIDHITILYLSPSHARHSLLWSSPSLVERYRMIWASCESSHLIWPMENPGIYDLFPLDGVEHGFCFSIYWECHHTNLLIFLRGVGIPPTRFHFFYFFTMCFLSISNWTDDEQRFRFDGRRPVNLVVSLTFRWTPNDPLGVVSKTTVGL